MNSSKAHMIIAGSIAAAALALFALIQFISIPPNEVTFDRTIRGEPSVVTVTTPKPEPEPELEPVNMIAFGDMMLDRAVRQKIEKNGATYPFEPIASFLEGRDIVVANAEGPFTSNASLTEGVHNGPLTFTFDPAVLPTLKALGFTLLSQANNHSLNFGTEGLRESESNIENAGMHWFGDPSNVNVATYTTTIRGITISFIGYHEFAEGAVDGAGFDAVISAIHGAREKGAFVIIYPHWGTEYNQGFDMLQRRLAHSFVDAGADVILGAHPHVIEPIETYKGKAIFYSLGNFVFDQSQQGPTSEGLSVGISIASTSATYHLYPLRIHDRQASLMEDPRKTELLASLAASSTAAFVQGGIESGKFTLTR